MENTLKEKLYLAKSKRSKVHPNTFSFALTRLCDLLSPQRNLTKPKKKHWPFYNIQKTGVVFNPHFKKHQKLYQKSLNQDNDEVDHIIRKDIKEIESEYGLKFTKVRGALGKLKRKFARDTKSQYPTLERIINSKIFHW